MPDGYVTGSSWMSYCNQTPFPREGWGLGTRLVPSPPPPPPPVFIVLRFAFTEMEERRTLYSTQTRSEKWTPLAVQVLKVFEPRSNCFRVVLKYLDQLLRSTWTGGGEGVVELFWGSSFFCSVCIQYNLRRSHHSRSKYFKVVPKYLDPQSSKQ